jgi:hypothetical protein
VRKAMNLSGQWGNATLAEKKLTLRKIQFEKSGQKVS